MEERENKRLLDNWYAAFDLSGKDLKVFTDAEHEEGVRIRLLNKIVAHIPESKRRPHLFIRTPIRWMNVAAVLAFFLLSIPIYQYLKKYDRQHITATTLTSSKAGSGKMLKVTLADGSEILLNSGSELRYPRQFSGKQRLVYLNGEAFFKVKHRADQPFVVTTGKIKTTVLGTSFNIKAYSGLDHIAVNVATGKVAVAASGKTLALLLPNQQINVQTASGNFELLEFNAQLASSWQDGKIRLDGASFKELSLVIKNAWGLTLETKSARITAANFKTTFHTNNKITEVMKAISKMTGAKYRIRDHTITLYE
ncbi:hypothetical protein AQ505_04460 [Pedobacter sp. PACM 27299]|uniref:FecR family protein n=1 Tax=Pedobacter sp. PACM 27299 TaxID=1727164 RepID=UPI00070637D6|nr:FecR family protein [Pedobacter sp. PACM 27299]ALL04800.1 hypothetical protein AQ505_04460 [Pedobacter sp. PACM 27299]